MYRIAIVDDKKEESDNLRNCIEDYFKDANADFSVKIFNNEVEFLDDFCSNYDVVFLDMQMPNFDGIEVAREMRIKDEEVCIVFVTQFACYAVKSYEVSAFDYLVKPITFNIFAPKMDRIIRKISFSRKKRYIYLKDDSEMVRVDVGNILYIEVKDHNLFYHTPDKIYRITKKSMKIAEQELQGGTFLRCNDCYLINMRHVTGIRGNEFLINGESLYISRSKKKECMKKFADFIGGGVE